MILSASLALVAAGDAAAQIPVAAGRQFNLSNAAWKVFIPSTYQPRSGNVADLLVHFHGDPQTVWNNAKYAELNTIIRHSELQRPVERVLDAVFQQLVVPNRSSTKR